MNSVQHPASPGALPTQGARRRRAPLALLVLLCLALAGCGAATEASLSETDPTSLPEGTNTATLTWEAPTMNTDGSALTDLSTFHVYYGRQPGVYSRRLSAGLVTEFTVTGLGSGRYYFAVDAVAASGYGSALSDEVSIDLP